MEVSFLKKLQLSTATLLKKRLPHNCFPVSFPKLLRTRFFTEHLRWLFLYPIVFPEQGSGYSAENSIFFHFYFCCNSKLKKKGESGGEKRELNMPEFRRPFFVLRLFHGEVNCQGITQVYQRAFDSFS